MKNAAFIFVIITLWTGSAFAQTAKPVVIELFTAQGCPDCAEADTLVKQLASEDPDLIILPCHESTSDDLGWKDGMAQKICTERHNAYEDSIDLFQNKTPTAILNGKYAVIGAKEDLLRAAIKMARSIDDLNGLQISKSENTLDITLPQTQLENPVDVFFVVLGNAQTLQIMDGENIGLSVPYMGPVKYFFKLFTWNGTYKNTRIPLKAYDAPSYAVVIQEPETGAILKAAVTD